jgi:hypothetical protein
MQPQTQQLPQYQVPAYLLDNNPYVVQDTSAFVAGIGGSRGPHISLNNGQFQIVNGDVVKQPANAQGHALFDPKKGLVYIDVIVLDTSHSVAKVYYEKGYAPGDNAPPDCWSNDALYPDASIAEPQDHSCAMCAKNKFGSAVNAVTGAQGKACADRKRLAVLFLHDLKGPILELSVSPSNLRGWSDYAREVAGRVPGGVTSVVTRVYPDTSRTGGMFFEVAPNPQFATPESPTGSGWWFVPQGVMPYLAEARASDECKKAIGVAAPQMKTLGAPAPTPALSYEPAPVAPAGGQPAALPATGAPVAESRRRRTKKEIEEAKAAEQALLLESAGRAAAAVGAAPVAAAGPASYAAPTPQPQPAPQPQVQPPAADPFAAAVSAVPASPLVGQPLAPAVYQAVDPTPPAPVGAAFGVATGVSASDPALDLMLSQLGK